MNFERVHGRDEFFGDVPALADAADDEFPFVAPKACDGFDGEVEAAACGGVGFIETSEVGEGCCFG